MPVYRQSYVAPAPQFRTVGNPEKRNILLPKPKEDYGTRALDRSRNKKTYSNESMIPSIKRKYADGDQVLVSRLVDVLSELERGGNSPDRTAKLWNVARPMLERLEAER